MNGTSRSAEPDYLVLAPPTGDLPFLVPMGLLDLVHRAGRPVRGYYAHEIDWDAVRRARVVVIPVHWYLSLDPAIHLARRVKRLNPRVVLVTGGMTASAYPDLLMAAGPFDYIVRGDAEGTFPALLAGLLSGGEVRGIANLAWRGGQTDLTYRIDAESLAASRNRDVAWFPSLHGRHWPPSA